MTLGHGCGRQTASAASVTARMLVALMQRDPRARELVTDVLPEVFPWVAFLSRDEGEEFVVELVATLRAAESLDNPAPVVQVIDAWRHTAEALARRPRVGGDPRRRHL